MKKILLALALITAFSYSIFSQDLLPAINSGVLPSDSDPICSSPPFTGSFETNGYDVGDTISQFTVFDLNNTAFDIQNELQNGKPVLLISASLTCPIFRNNVPVINDVISIYGTDLRVIIVYTLEAHPTDISPYSGNVNLTQQNISEGILFPQPTSYYERKELVDTLLDIMTINAPVYLDGPCNEWWLNFGPAPNNAYLIDTNGIVFAKHGMLNKYPLNIFCDIDSLLGTSGNCVPPTNTGTFMLDVIDTISVGYAGTVIYADAQLINNSTDPAEVMIKKIQENYALGWDVGFCVAGACYPTSVDSTIVLVPAGDSISFSADFFTSSIPDSSNIKVGFKNINSPNNQFSFRFYAYTEAELAIHEMNATYLQVFPNPSSNGEFTFVLSEAMNENFQVNVSDLSGRILFTEQIGAAKQFKIKTNLGNGIYFYSLSAEKQIYHQGKIMVKN